MSGDRPNNYRLSDLRRMPAPSARIAVEGRVSFAVASLRDGWHFDRWHGGGTEFDALVDAVLPTLGAWRDAVEIVTGIRPTIHRRYVYALGDGEQRLYRVAIGDDTREWRWAWTTGIPGRGFYSTRQAALDAINLATTPY